MSTENAGGSTALDGPPSAVPVVYVVVDVHHGPSVDVQGMLDEIRRDLVTHLRTRGMRCDELQLGGVAVTDARGELWVEEAGPLERGPRDGYRTRGDGHPGVGSLQVVAERLRTGPWSPVHPCVLYVVDRGPDYIDRLVDGLRGGPAAQLSHVVRPIGVLGVDDAALVRFAEFVGVPPVRTADLFGARAEVVRLVRSAWAARLGTSEGAVTGPVDGRQLAAAHPELVRAEEDDVTPYAGVSHASAPAGSALREPAVSGGGEAIADVMEAESLASVEPDWRGSMEPYAVGDPGRAAATVVPRVAIPHRDRPDTVLDAVTVAAPDGRDRAVLRAASARGLKHRYAGTVRQDSYAFRLTDDRCHLVVAVADGVSEAARSDEGADHVARESCAELARVLADGGLSAVDWADVARHLNRGLREICRADADPEGPEALEQVSQQLASTAVVAVVDLEAPPQETPVVIWAVGDTAAWVLREGRRWEPQATVKNADAMIATSETLAFPLPRASVPAPTRTMLGPADVLVLMTDGIGDPLASGTGTVGRFLADNWATPPDRLAFAGQVDFARRSHDDDRTAVAVWPGGTP